MKVYDSQKYQELAGKADQEFRITASMKRQLSAETLDPYRLGEDSVAQWQLLKLAQHKPEFRKAYNALAGELTIELNEQAVASGGEFRQTPLFFDMIQAELTAMPDTLERA